MSIKQIKLGTKTVNLFKPYIFSNIFVKPKDELNKSCIYINKLKENKIKIKSVIIILYFVIITNLIKNAFMSNEYKFLKLYYSKISLKINGIGNKKIYNTNTPDEIFINGNKTDSINNYYDFKEMDNYIELFWFNNIINCENMFYDCSSIVEMDLSNFLSSEVNSTEFMFYGCSSLTSINFTNFDTSNVEIMAYMFCGCLSLISLNLDSFDTSRVTNMVCMFSGCNSLISINLSSFAMHNVLITDAMFLGCSSLLSLDLSNFVTPSLQTFGNMFSGCSSLRELNISKFDTKEVYSMSQSFNGCSSLTSLDLSSFNTYQTV